MGPSFKFRPRNESFGSLTSLARRGSIIDIAKEYVMDKMDEVEEQGKVVNIDVVLTGDTIYLSIKPYQ